MEPINNIKSHEADESAPLNKVQQRQLRTLIEKGLPVVSQPFLTLAQSISSDCGLVSEQSVIQQIELWQEAGLIKRFGLVVKHRKLGFTANAMVVWNIPDENVDHIARLFSSHSEVSLCYRRPRRLPDWPYNLFCMVHGKNRDIVLSQIENMVKVNSLHAIEKDVLFSITAFKQQGARYSKLDKKSLRGAYA